MSAGFYRSGHTKPLQRDIDKPIEPATKEELPVDISRMRGFTGNICVICGSATLIQAGHCEVCTNCGTTTGCS